MAAVKKPTLDERVATAYGLLEADRSGWQLERYQTWRPSVNGPAAFTHFVIFNKRANGRARDLWLRFHGAGASVLHASGAHREVLKSFSQSVSWVLESGSTNTIYAFVTTETTAYGGYFHDLCQDESCDLNVDYPLGDWGYALVGGTQTQRHLERLQTFGFVPGLSKITSVGFSDGAWMSSMHALRGLARHAVAWGGWSFARFDEWKALLPTDAAGMPSVRGMQLDVYISAGDTFYNGTSGFYPPPEQEGSMLAGLRSIAAFYDLEPAPVDTVAIAGTIFERRIFANAVDGNVIACHVDVDRAHDHHWVVTQEPLLRATARVSLEP